MPSHFKRSLRLYPCPSHNIRIIAVIETFPSSMVKKFLSPNYVQDNFSICYQNENFDRAKTLEFWKPSINPLKPELNPICYLLALLAHHFLHVSRIRVKSLTIRLLMSYIYIYMEHLFLMFLDHTQRRSTVGRTPLDE